MRLLETELVELQLRQRASLITNLIVLILNSSLVVQPAAHWYAMKVMKAIEMQHALEVFKKNSHRFRIYFQFLQKNRAKEFVSCLFLHFKNMKIFFI